jgi:hypothetical protein
LKGIAMTSTLDPSGVAAALHEEQAARVPGPQDPLEEQKSLAAYRMFRDQVSAEETTRNQIIGFAIAGISFLIGVITTQTMPIWLQLLLIIAGYAGIYVCEIREENRCRNIVKYTNAGLDAESEDQRVSFYSHHDARFTRFSFTRGEAIFFIGFLILTAFLVVRIIPHINE